MPVVEPDDVDGSWRERSRPAPGPGPGCGVAGRVHAQVGEALTAAGQTPVSPARMSAVFGALLVPSFVALGAPSVALPSMARGLGVSFGALSWVLASWALCSAVAMPLFGRLSRRVGLRASLIVGVVLVAVGSITAALSPGLGVLIAGRSVGGAGAGALIISSYATVNARFEGAARGRALAVVAAVVITGSGCGTLIGGLLTAWPGWRMVLAVPALAVLMAWPAARLATADRSPTARIGVGGAVLVTVVGGAWSGCCRRPPLTCRFWWRPGSRWSPR